MAKKIMLIVLFVAGVFTLKAQQYLVTLKEQGTKMANSAVTGDYKTLLKYTHPKVIQAMGGTSKAYQIIANGMDKLKASGAEFEKASVGDHQQLIVGKTNIQCLITQNLSMKIQGNNIQTVTYLFCITYNGGKDWYFTDVGRGNDVQVRRLLPEMNPKIVVPKSDKKTN